MVCGRVSLEAAEMCATRICGGEEALELDGRKAESEAGRGGDLRMRRTREEKPSVI